MQQKFFSKARNFLRSELGLFLVISFLLIGISASVEVKRQLDTPKGQVFSGLEFYSDDYSIYVSNIFQGQRGRWTLLDKHTTEPHQGTIIHDEYLLWGKYTNLFHIDPITSYHLARYTFGFILLGMVYLLLLEIFPNKKNVFPSLSRDPAGANQPTHPLDSSSRLGGTQNDNMSIDIKTNNSLANSQKLIANSYLRKISFFLITFATGFVIWKVDPVKGLTFDFHMNWLTEMDNFYRFVALPHYLLGNIFFLGALITFLKYLKSDIGHWSLVIGQKTIVQRLLSNDNLFWGAFCSLMLALIHPVALVSLLALLGIYLLFVNIIKMVSSFKLYIVHFTLNIFSRENVYFMACLLVSAPVMLYYRSQFSVAPWNHMAAWEGVTQYYVPLEEFAQAIGPTFFLGIVGFIGMLFNLQFTMYPSLTRLGSAGRARHGADNVQLHKIDNQGPSTIDLSANSSAFPADSAGTADRQQPARIDMQSVAGGPIANSQLPIIIILFSWILSFFLLIYFSYPFLHISQVRFMQVFIFIPFGIFAAYGIFFIGELVAKFFARAKNLVNIGKNNISSIGSISRIGTYLSLVILVIIIFISLPYYYASLELKYRFFSDYSVLIYPLQETVDGYYWLRDHTDPEKAVLTAFLGGTQIPYFSNNTVYVGHLWATLNRKAKEELQNRFLDNQMSVEEAKEFFRKNHLYYFFYGFQERSYPVQPQNYPFLKKVYENPSTTIYEAVY